MSLLVLDVTFNGRLRDFVDPRLLNFHLNPAEMNVEVFAHAISNLDLSSLLERPPCSADGDE